MLITRKLIILFQEYLGAYESAALKKWMLLLENHDTTAARLIKIKVVKMPKIIMVEKMIMTCENYNMMKNIPSPHSLLPHFVSSCVSGYSVRLVASVPGAHKEAAIKKWGHLKLRKVRLLFVEVLLVTKSQGFS